MRVFFFSSVLISCVAVAQISALNLDKCRNGQMDIVNGMQTNITCTGLFRHKNYTWSIITPSTGTERTIGTCESCRISPCPTCDVPHTGYSITRGPNSLGSDVSTVGFVASEANHHNTTIRCSRSNDLSGVTCRINVIEVYRLSSCFVVENAQTPISCSYREPSHGMYWSLTYPNRTVTRMAECAPCVNNTCPDCDVNNTDFRVTRDEKSSVIKMVNGSDVDKDNAWLICSRIDNVTADDCTIKVFWREEDGKVSVAAVAGGVVAAVVVVIAFVVIVIVVVRRRTGHLVGLPQNDLRRENPPAENSSPADNYLTPVAPSSMQQDDTHTYEGLRMPDVYSDVGNAGNVVYIY